MLLPSTLFFLSFALASGSLWTNGSLLKVKPEEGKNALLRNQDRRHRSVHSQGNLKVLDFGEDNDQKPDSNGERTGASFNAGSLPQSFTICSSLMVDSWPTKSARMFTLLDARGQWGYIHLSAYIRKTRDAGDIIPANFLDFLGFSAKI